MKTVAEAAKLLGITPQAVYKKVNHQLKAELQPFVTSCKRGSTTVVMLKDEGISVIRASLARSAETVGGRGFNVDNEPSRNDSGQVQTDSAEFIAFLQEQIKVKDDQIASLTSSLNEALAINKNQQFLTLQQGKKPRWIDRFRKKD